MYLVDDEVLFTGDSHSWDPELDDLWAEKATEMLTAAGFDFAQVAHIDEDIANSYYVATATVSPSADGRS